MHLILSIPMPIRLAVVFALGACIGAAVNWAVCSLAWNRRPISPWSRPDPSASRRRLGDRLPIVGWLGLRREASLHGAGFWIRPMLIEVLVGVGFAWLYWWEAGNAGLLPPDFSRPLNPGVLAMLHVEFVSHLILVGLMLAASLIDFDEMTIPDGITVVGTLVGLLAAALCPESLLPVVPRNGPPNSLTYLHLASPNEWPAALRGAPDAPPLVLGLACWLAWCAAMLSGPWFGRHGWRWALQISCAHVWHKSSRARLRREPCTRWILPLAVIGSAAIALVWYCGGDNWQGLLTALVGMAVGGGFVWAIRILCTVALQREAMGFGDVTLMAMFGAFLGWQASLIVFFLAPLAGVVISILRLIFLRDKEIFFGPFLCLAALSVVVFWDTVWSGTEHAFAIGWLVPAAVLCCPPMMFGMLATWRLIVSVFRPKDTRRKTA
jgi:leader peptidase (prepilin peptidase) / N-methyltransferase